MSDHPSEVSPMLSFTTIPEGIPYQNAWKMGLKIDFLKIIRNHSRKLRELILGRNHFKIQS